MLLLLCCLVYVVCFATPYRLRLIVYWKKIDVSMELCLLPALRWFLRPWRWDMLLRNVCWISKGLHGVISQTTELFIVAAVGASIPTSNSVWGKLQFVKWWPPSSCVSPVSPLLRLNAMWAILSVSVYGYTPHVCLGRFFSFLNLYTSGRTPWTSQGRYLHTDTDIHAWSGIRTHDRSARAGEDGSCQRPHGHSDWQVI
jgi:hypothetical protein